MLSLAALGTVVSLGAVDQATRDSNLARLRLMPAERRRQLAQNLDRFDALPGPEQTAIRELDRQLNESDPETRARYESVLHRYHVWLQSLSPEQRQQLEQTPPDQRIALVHEILSAQKTGPDRLEQARAQNVLLSPVSVFDQAHWIRIWRAIEPDERKEIERMRTTADRVVRLEQLGRELEIPRNGPSLDRIEQSIENRIQNRPVLKQKFSAAREQTKRQIAKRIADARFLHDFKPAPVERANLDRFLDSIPPWLRASFDPLPPEAALQRVTVLYRLIFPAPEEIPIEEPAASRPETPSGYTRPDTGGATTPF